MLITNKHVIDGSLTIGLRFHVTVDGNKTPLPGPGKLIAVDTNLLPIAHHPDPGVDLAGIPLAGVIEYAVKTEGWFPYIKGLNRSHLPSAKMMNDLGAVEDVLMIGYPTGLIDQMNNFPIVRRGITSTPYKSDYRGKAEFLADIPVYGGSSGSPIVILNEGAYSTGTSLSIGFRFALIGVLYAGHTETMDGQVIAEPIPTNLSPIARVTHMINLGLCIKSALIEELATQIQWQ